MSCICHVFLTLSSFSLNCLTTFFSQFVKSDCTADTTSEGFGARLKYSVMVDILTSCYSSVVSFDFIIYAEHGEHGHSNIGIQ